jgi:hypothetical protein
MGAMGLMHEILFHDTIIGAKRVIVRVEDAQLGKRYNNSISLLCLLRFHSFLVLNVHAYMLFILLQAGAKMLR